MTEQVRPFSDCMPKGWAVNIELKGDYFSSAERRGSLAVLSVTGMRTFSMGKITFGYDLWLLLVSNSLISTNSGKLLFCLCLLHLNLKSEEDEG